MRKIYVLDENNELKTIDAGITQYSELTDSPVYTTYNGVQLVGSTVRIVNNELVVEPSLEHAWTDKELYDFCLLANSGRYDILTESQGQEILLIDLSKEEILGRRYRRIGVDNDQIWDSETSQWIYISDTSAKQLIYKFLNQDEIKGTVVVGDPFHIRLYYYSNIGTGRVTVTMNGVSITAGTVKSGEEIDINLTNRIVDGENTISVKIANDATEAFIPEIAVTGINLTYNPTFNQYQPFKDSITFPYNCSGSSKKVVHIDVTNSSGETNSVEVNHSAGYINTSVILNKSYFTKGENYISTYMYAVDDLGNEVTRTISTNYVIPFLTDNNPLLMVYFNDWDNLKQYSSISIPYYVWSNGAISALDSISFKIESNAFANNYEYNYDTEDAGALVNYLSCNERHSWLISSLPTTFKDGVDYKSTFRIAGNLTNEFVKENVSIESSSDALQTVSGYQFNFAASDLTKAINEWTSTGSYPKVMQLNNFNWNNDGIQIDKDGNQSLHFSSAASAVVSEETNTLFGSYDLPFTLEFDFKVSASASEEVIARYYDPTAVNPNNYGLFIYPNKAIFKYTGGSSEINYIRGERTNLTYVICNQQITDKNPNTQVEGVANLQFLFTYVNGILSKMQPLDAAAKFPTQCGTMEFNCSSTEFDLYAFRGYNSSLSSAQILQNYISNFGKAETKESMFMKNNMYSTDKTTAVNGEFAISFDKVKGKIPCYVLFSDVTPEDKSYVKCYSIFYEADGDRKLTEWKNGISRATTYYYTRKDTNSPWIRNKAIKVCAQGTSSLAYPRKNFKFKHNDKFYIKGHKYGPDKTYTFKADYMDSSGANNIGNAQVMDNAVIRDRWVNTPVATNKDLRINLDGFPIAMFWCKTTSLREGVVQDEAIENVYDNDKVTRLYDAIKVNDTNPLIGEVVPQNPQYIGTFNFNYDKKAKALLGWDSNTFQGVEFRGNSSSADLFRGFENMCALASTSEGFEWRWTYDSDWIDDYHDGNLLLTIDGGYFDEDVKQKYSEAQYLANRKDIVYVRPYNQFYVIKDGVKCQLFEEKEDGTYSPINYGSINPNNFNWDLTSCEGISKMSNGICLECGIKTAEKDGIDSLVYQLPYGVDESNSLGKSYPDGSHYYKFSWNPEHEFKFEYNDTQEYFTNIDNWTTILPLSKVKALKTTYIESEYQEGLNLYVLDDEDGLYHMLSNYPLSEQENLKSKQLYIRNDEYLNVYTADYVYTWDFMREVFKNWCYVVEAVNHCTSENFKAILDYNQTWGNNGRGLFVYDALLNYYCSSVITGLCDNFAKNMFMHSYDRGLSWSPAWYDMDTCYGLNNQGSYTKLYDIDFMDIDTTGARAFNGSNSKLWELLYNNDMVGIKNMYQTLRNSDYISYEKIMNVLYGENISFKSESLYNANAVYRYMEPAAWHGNNKPEAAQGSRLQLLKYWIGNRQVFLDSRYEGIGWSGDTIILRLNNTVPVTFNLVPDTNMFLGANFNSGEATVPSVKSSEKVKAGETWSCGYGPSTNLNTYIYGASHLLEVGDLSLCNSEEYSVGNATNLKELKIGDEVHPTTVVTSLNLSAGSPYNNLKLLDLTNTKLKNTSLNLKLGDGRDLMPVLETLKLKGSNIEYLTLSNYSPLKYISFPNTIHNIDLVNLLSLEEAEVYETNNLERIRLINCPKINQLDIIKKVQNNTTISISADNLQADENNALTIDFMNWLVDINAELSGNIYVESISDENLNIYRKKWRNLTINLKQIYAKDVIFGITGEGGLDE